MERLQLANQYTPGTAEAVRLIQRRRLQYERLTLALGTWGTEILRYRTLINDQDEPPHTFVSAALHEFVFPMLPFEMEIHSKIIDQTPRHEKIKEDCSLQVNDVFEGRLRVRYNDCGGTLLLGVEDRHQGRSSVPKAISSLVAQMAEVA